MKTEKGLLVISFGTSYIPTRKVTLEAIEADLRAAFPERKFCRAWTSGFLRNRVREKEGLPIDAVPDALKAMQKDGIRDVLIQPTHLLHGTEFEAALEQIRSFAGAFDRLCIGKPLLSDQEDVQLFADLIPRLLPADPGREMIAWMGHGSADEPLQVYDRLNELFLAGGHPQICVGTVEFEPGIRPVLARIRERHPEKVILAPMLIVAGDHALNDMAGKDPDSWKSRMEAEQTRVECVIKGLGEYPEIRALYVEHAKRAEEIE